MGLPATVFGAQESVIKSSAGWTGKANVRSLLLNNNAPLIRDPHDSDPSGTPHLSGAPAVAEENQTDDWRVEEKGYL